MMMMSLQDINSGVKPGKIILLNIYYKLRLNHPKYTSRFWKQNFKILKML